MNKLKHDHSLRQNLKDFPDDFLALADRLQALGAAKNAGALRTCIELAKQLPR